MSEHPNTASASDPDFRRMVKWVAITLLLTLALAIVVVEVTIRWFGPL
jgi:hypothetical protein